MTKAPAPDPRIGSILAGYRLEARLGRGGMGVVYRAEHVRLGRPAAVKVVLPELAQDAGFRARFAREAQIAATLDHPHVVTVHDAGEEDGTLYLAMQLVDGGDLAVELHAHGRLGPARALRVCGQVADALDAAHARGLVHRDVKPANVLLDGRGAHLSDFGLSRLGEAHTGGPRLEGTSQYVAPEQVLDRQPDGRADQYALACVLHHCLCGAPPFERDSPAATLDAHLRDPPPRASGRRPELPEALDDVLARGLDKVPGRRFESCGALVAAAREALEAAGPPGPTASRAVPADGDDPSVVTLTEPPGAIAGSAAAGGGSVADAAWVGPGGFVADAARVGAGGFVADAARVGAGGFVADAARVGAVRDPTRVVLAGVDAQTRALALVALGRGAEVREVADGEAGVAAALDSPADLLLLDWAAPGMAAAEAIAALRADPETREVKVVLVVDWRAAGGPDVQAARADATLETPFSPLQLQVGLRRLLGSAAVG